MNIKSPTKQTYRKIKTKQRSFRQLVKNSAHGRPSEMANIKRGPAEENPRDCVVIRKTGDQIHKSSDTNRSNDVT